MALRFVIRAAPEVLLGGASVSPAATATSADSDEIAYCFDQERVVIGRGASADVRLPHRSVSSHHATVFANGNNHTIVDAGSTNGTHLDGQAVPSDRPKSLRDGDLITVGDYILSFHLGRTATPLVTAERTAELAKHMLRNQRRVGTAALGHPRFVVLNGPQTGQSLDVPEPPVTLLVGRGENCQLQLSDANISREHMEVSRDLEGVTIKNRDSANGVRWGGHAVQERRVRDGDELVLGATRLLFEDPAEELMKSLSAEADVVQSALPSLPEPPTAAETASAVIEAPPEPEAKPRRKSASGPAPADVVIYVFAAAVLALSAAGIMFLLRGG